MITEFSPENLESLKLEKRKFPDLKRQLIVFSLESEEFGIPVSWVKEVLEPQWYSLVPGGSPSVCGAINHQGNIFTILNLPLMMETTSLGENESKSILLLNDSLSLIGLETGRIKEITHFDEEQLNQGFEKIEKPKTSYVISFFRCEDRIINIIEIDLILKQLKNII